MTPDIPTRMRVESGSSVEWRWPVGAMLVVFLFAAPSLRDAGFLLDDTVNLARHAHHGDILGEWHTPTYTHADPTRGGHVWRPIPASLQHLLAVFVGRDTALPFRLLTLGFHLVNVLLAYALARGLGASTHLATGAAIVAGAHAIALESACWASCLFDVSMTTVVLGFAVLNRRVGTNLGLALAAGAAGVLASLCKETSIALWPVVAGTTWVSSPDPGRDRATRTATAGIAYLLGTIGVLGYHDQLTGQPYASAIHTGSIVAYFAAWLQAAGWWFNHGGGAPLSHGFVAAEFAPLSLGVATLAIGCVAAESMRRHIAPRSPLGWLALLAWLAPLAPAAIVVVTTGTASVRLGYAGWLLAIPVGFAALGGTCGVRYPRGLLAVLGIVAAASSVGSLSRPSALRTEVTLWRDELAYEPTSWAQARAARFRWVDDHSDAALVQWRAAIEAAPSGLLFVKPRSEWWDYAQAAFLSGRPTWALHALDTLAILAVSSGDLPPMYPCLRADTLDLLGRSDEANVASRACPGAPSR